MEQLCAICKAAVDSDTAPVLTVGGFGNVRYLCEECDAELADVTAARDTELIASAMERISKKMAASDKDATTLATVEEIMRAASEHAEKIKEGTYDFAEDGDGTADGEEEIPEELLESEEDKALEEETAKRNAKLDKITNIVCLVVFIAVFAFCAYKIIKTFL